MKRGQIRLYTFRALDKRRPVLVLSRQDVIGLQKMAKVCDALRIAMGCGS